MEKPFAVVFAGVPGSSKSIVAFYLSGKFGLPIFSNDNLRYEVKEDMLISSLVLPEDLMRSGINEPKALAEFEKRLTERADEVLSTGRPIIIDGSVDRRWEERKNQLREHGYRWFMINMELSKTFLTKLFTSTGREAFLSQLDNYFQHHQDFMARYAGDVNLQITDQNFLNRNKLAAEALRKYIDGQN